MLSLSENLIIAQNSLRTQYPWLLLAELAIGDSADTYHRWVQDYGDIVTLLTTYGGNNVAAHWKLNDNAWSTLVTDASGNGNHGTAQRNTALLHLNGKTGGAFDLDGSTDSVNLGEILPMGTNSCSISAWFKTISVAASPANAIVQNKSTAGPTNAGYRLLAPAGMVTFHIADGTNQAVVLRGSGLNDGEWHHVVGTVDRDTDLMKVYVDGSLSGDAVSTAAVGDITSTNDLCIGSLLDTYHFFDGAIDNVILFDKALTAADVAALYNSGLGTEMIPAKFGSFNFDIDQVTYKGGEMPKTTLRLSNVTQFVKSDLENNRGCTSSEITLRIVHANQLYEDYSELDVSFEVIYPRVTAKYVEFVIGGPSPLRRRFPLERFFADACRYVSGFPTDPRCGYPGAETACSGLRSRCRELNNEANFGGFPGLRPETMQLA